MNGLRAGMSAAPSITAARVAAGVTPLTCQKRKSERNAYGERRPNPSTEYFCGSNILRCEV